MERRTLAVNFCPNCGSASSEPQCPEGQRACNHLAPRWGNPGCYLYLVTVLQRAANGAEFDSSALSAVMSLKFRNGRDELCSLCRKGNSTDPCKRFDIADDALHRLGRRFVRPPYLDVESLQEALRARIIRRQKVNRYRCEECGAVRGVFVEGEWRPLNGTDPYLVGWFDPVKHPAVRPDFPELFPNAGTRIAGKCLACKRVAVVTAALFSSRVFSRHRKRLVTSAPG